MPVQTEALKCEVSWQKHNYTFGILLTLGALGPMISCQYRVDDNNIFLVIMLNCTLRKNILKRQEKYFPSFSNVKETDDRKGPTGRWKTGRESGEGLWLLEHTSQWKLENVDLNKQKDIQALARLATESIYHRLNMDLFKTHTVLIPDISTT